MTGDAPAALTVYAVEYGNYSPAEIDSLWATQELADRRVARLNAGQDAWPWYVKAWQVGTE